MKHIQLTDEIIRTHSGADIWDYLFENVPLPKKYRDGVEILNLNDDDEKIVWLKTQLLEGEEWAFLDDKQNFVFTNECRVFNIKLKKPSKVMKYASALRVNAATKGYNLNKLIEEKWNIDIEYDDLCDEAKKMISQLDYKRR